MTIQRDTYLAVTNLMERNPTHSYMLECTSAKTAIAKTEDGNVFLRVFDSGKVGVHYQGTDYYIAKGRPYTSEGEIPEGLLGLIKKAVVDEPGTLKFLGKMADYYNQSRPVFFY